MSLVESKDNLEEIKNAMLSALNRAGNDPKSAFRFIILNTISGGFPNSRYVVLRKFTAKDQELYIYTDIRSNKISEIKENPFVSILAYDNQKKCQIKLEGKISTHHQDEVTDMHWKALQGGMESYNTEKGPGKEVASLKEAQKMKREFDGENFAVLVLKVSQAEILQLNGKGHIRALFDFENNTSSFLVP
jgi:hypothetical protein